MTLFVDLVQHEWPDPGPDGRYPAKFPPMTAAAIAVGTAAPPPRTLNAGVFSTCGARGPDKMEDRHVVARNVNDIPGAHLVGVFDGHRGAECAEFAHRNIEAALTSCWNKHDDPKEALREAFKSVDAAFVDAFAKAQIAAHDTASEEEAGGGGGGGGTLKRYPGCTAAVALVWGETLYVANAGDCRTVLCRDYNTSAHVALSVDHAAQTNAKERERIIADGGILRQHGSSDGGGGGGGGCSWRVGQTGLAVTRAMGDADVKGDGVTADPEVTETKLFPEDEYFIMACDGLWVRMLRRCTPSSSACLFIIIT